MAIFDNNSFDTVFNSACLFFNLSKDLHDEDNIELSLICFAISLEQFLKLRLFKEHWSLAIDDIGSFNKNDALQGDFYTVTASNIISRIEKCELGEFSDKEKESYSNIFRLRNKIVHFYHESVDKKEANRLVLISWRYIHKRLTEEWKNIFTQDHISKINEITNELSWLSDYASIVFKEKENIIELEKENGVTVKRCNMCNQMSYLMDKINTDEELFAYVKYKCCVCEYSDDELTFICKCGKSVKIGYDKELLECPYCKNKIKYQENLYCSTCGTKTIYGNNSFFICTRCWSEHEVDEETIACPDCGKVFFTNNMEEFDDKRYCQSCFQKNYENIDSKLRTIKKLHAMLKA